MKSFAATIANLCFHKEFPKQSKERKFLQQRPYQWTQPRQQHEVRHACSRWHPS
ncbi:hypothetical protein ACHAXS_003215 [Conticribra weissflogii]